jgi:pyruvate/2-oxoglutarate dehydrogenase complex dihydrolipoamide acyltransferase (E2) component
MSHRIYPITMPKWGIEMQEGTITKWHAVPGPALAKGDTLLDVETEKIVNSVEAPVAGTLRRIIADTGATEAVGALIAVFAAAAVTDAEVDAFIATSAGRHALRTGWRRVDRAAAPPAAIYSARRPHFAADADSTEMALQGQPDRTQACRTARYRRHQDQGHGQPRACLEGRRRDFCAADGRRCGARHTVQLRR